MAAWVAVGRVGDTAPGSGKVIVLGERRLALFDDDGEYRVLDDACPHQGASLGEGSSFRGTVVCPWHSWSFDLKSGVCIALNFDFALQDAKAQFIICWVKIDYQTTLQT